jgi:seryl-tRNA synthetase
MSPKSHLEIGQDLDLLYFPILQGKGKTYYARNDAALLELALVQWALATVSQKYGFVPHMTPDIMSTNMVEACGFQPRSTHTQVYKVADEDLCLVGTQEIPLAALYYNSIIPEKMLPIKLAAFGHCFRAEAGDGGAENRGLYRVHQFSKVEMFVFSTPEQSEQIHKELLNIEVELLTQLGLHFKYESAVTDFCFAFYRFLTPR